MFCAVSVFEAVIQSKGLIASLENCNVPGRSLSNEDFSLHFRKGGLVCEE